MICKRCGRKIPESALKCPYCEKKTSAGWKHEGEKLISPVTKLIKKVKKTY